MIGISTEDATANNISVANIDKLSFDKEKFINAFKADPNEIKQLLVGTSANLGVFSRIENIVESAVATGAGYFSSAENSYKTQIQRLDEKISRATLAVERYKARLEKKFQTMDLLISNIQNQFSTFLGT